jgi:hypothetical protein
MPLGFQLTIVFVLGGGLGALVGWLIGRNRASATQADSRWETELRRQLAHREAEVVAKRDQLTKMMTSLATALTNQTDARKCPARQSLITPSRQNRGTGDGTNPRFTGEVAPLPAHSRSTENGLAAETHPALVTGFDQRLFAEIK